jgi:hypothetical protein
MIEERQWTRIGHGGRVHANNARRDKPDALEWVDRL